MLQLQAEGIGGDFLLVDVVIAVIVIPVRTWQQLAIVDRHTELRQVVVFLMLEGEGHAGRRAQAESDRRGDAPALVILVIAPRRVVAVGHQIEARRRGVVELLVGVQGDALVVVGADRRADLGEITHLRRLGHQIDGAAHRPATGVNRTGAVDDFHLLQVERVGAAVLRAVTHAVDLDVVAGRETPQVDAVAITTAALPGAEGDARYSAEDVAHGQQVLIFDDLLRHHGDGLRGVTQQLGVFRRCRRLRLITVGFGRTAHRQAFELERRGLLGIRLGSDHCATVRNDGKTNGGYQQRFLRQRGRQCWLVVMHGKASRKNASESYLLQIVFFNTNTNNS